MASENDPRDDRPNPKNRAHDHWGTGLMVDQALKSWLAAAHKMAAHVGVP
jgi:hypothetical protein